MEHFDEREGEFMQDVALDAQIVIVCMQAGVKGLEGLSTASGVSISELSRRAVWLTKQPRDYQIAVTELVSKRWFGMM